jgi:hypothetical protein
MQKVKEARRRLVEALKADSLTWEAERNEEPRQMI